MSIIKTVTPPTEMAITRAEAGQWLRLEPDTILDEAAILDDLIAAATAFVESRCALRLIQQTVEIALPRFPKGLPVAPVAGIRSLEYRPFDNLAIYNDWSINKWRAVNLSEPRSQATQLLPIDPWPATATAPDAVIVTAWVGWQKAAQVPAAIKTAMRMLIATAYSSRSGNISRRMSPSRASIDALLEPFRSYGPEIEHASWKLIRS